jgi:hypothetical protein
MLLLYNQYKVVFYFLALLSSFFFGCYLNGNRVSSNYDRKIAERKAIELENISLIERNFAKKISESDKNYAKQKNRIARRADAIDFGGLRIATRDCSPQTTAGASGVAGGAAGDGPGAGFADFGDVARKIAELGQDYDNSVAKINELSSLLKSCGG